MKSLKCSTRTLLGGLVAVAIAMPAAAQQAARVMGDFTGILQTDKIERPFFESLGAKMDNAFTVDYRNINVVGLKGFDAIRQLESGLFQFLAVPSGHVSGDASFFMGMDIPGLTPDCGTADTERSHGRAQCGAENSACIAQQQRGLGLLQSPLLSSDRRLL